MEYVIHIPRVLMEHKKSGAEAPQCSLTNEQWKAEPSLALPIGFDTSLFTEIDGDLWAGYC